VILSGPALAVIRSQGGPRTLFYLDPPYLHETRSTTDEYGEHEMTEADHAELPGVLRQVRGKVMLSGYPSELYESILHQVKPDSTMRQPFTRGAWISRSPCPRREQGRTGLQRNCEVLFGFPGSSRQSSRHSPQRLHFQAVFRIGLQDYLACGIIPEVQSGKVVRPIGNPLACILPT
jgi:hypothetical protein